MAELPRDMIFHYYSEDGITIKIDATELIRCRDCRRWRENEYLYKGKPLGDCGLMAKMTYEDSFCAWGERREDAD